MSQQPVTVLVWGVKQSFRNYVQATGGTTEVGEGVERTPDGEFIFAAAPDNALVLGDDGKPAGQGKFLGEIWFEAHGGMLKVRLANPMIEITDSGAALTVAEDGGEGARRLQVAQLDFAAITSDDTGDSIIPTALSMHGIQLLGDHYPLRTVLDPVRLRSLSR